MQCKLAYSMHINTKECHAGTERRHQQNMTVQSALALCQQVKVHGDIFEHVKVFCHLGHLLAQDDDEIQAHVANFAKLRLPGCRLGKFYTLKTHRPR
jgi:hypothetical protein